MNKLFNIFRSKAEKNEPIPRGESPTEEIMPPDDVKTINLSIEPDVPKETDGFTEWGRSHIRGGIERRERNDFFESYSVFGSDGKGQLICRFYHRYPEHEKDFDLTYSRVLSLREFNRRLLSELDKGDMKLDEYNKCIGEAIRLSQPDSSANLSGTSFTGDEISSLNGFCEDMDIFKEKSYLNDNGVYRCDCESAVGGETFNIRFRKPIALDALDDEVPGVARERIEGYDIENIWIMGVYNRVRDRSSSISMTKLASMWSPDNEEVFVIKADGFEGVDGTLLIAVGNSESFAKFGFYSLDFSKK